MVYRGERKTTISCPSHRDCAVWPGPGCLPSLGHCFPVMKLFPGGHCHMDVALSASRRGDSQGTVEHLCGNVLGGTETLVKVSQEFSV